MTQQSNLSKRYLILAVGILAMLFAGIIYAWSILKAPFKSELSYEDTALTLNYTLTMCFFCLGGFLASLLTKRIGSQFTILIAGTLTSLGFILTSLLTAESGILLYLTYALLAGLGIGILYIVIASAVNAWFPDKVGVSSGTLMMGFGFSSLLFGKIADALFNSSFGWRNTYFAIGVGIALVFTLSSFIIKAPDASVVLPQKKTSEKTSREDFETRDYTPLEMIRRFTFWSAFVAFAFVSAVGNSVISFAKDLAVSVGSEVSLATTLVGVLSICNGLSRIITGAAFDTLGRRITMIAACALTVIASGATLLAVILKSLPLCIAGLCLTGLAYGTVPTVSSVFTTTFYGRKHFSTNLCIFGLKLIIAAFIATACSSLQVSSGGYIVPFILLLSLSVISFILNLTVKKP